MKTFSNLLYSILSVIIFTAIPQGLYAQSRPVTYQGRLLANSAPATNDVYMTFTLYAQDQGGTPLAATLTNFIAIPETNGLFTTLLDFDQRIFTGASPNGYWLELGVGDFSLTNFSTLSPRQQITPTPFALTAQNLAGVIGYNIVDSSQSETVSGGYSNAVTVAYATVGGGAYNTNAGTYGTISGGYYNTNSNFWATIGGGQYNTNSAQAGTIGGGEYNTNFGVAATISGGAANTNYGSYCTIGGGSGNFAAYQYSTIAGGENNYVNGANGFIGGGQINTNSGPSAVISGGIHNVASGPDSTIAGGAGNVVTNFYSTVGGGDGNKSFGYYGTVGGGSGNLASGSSGTVGGGAVNIASGTAATVPGGQNNTASGNYSFAAGSYANAANNNSFVWSDGGDGTFSSTAANQFSVRAAGGIVLAGDISMAGGATTYHNLSMSGGNSAGFLYGSYPALGDGIHLGYNWYYDNSGSGHIINTGGGTSRISADYGEIQLATGGVNSTPVVRLDITTTAVTVENATFNGGTSDRNAKQDFADINPAQILEKVVHLPVSEWSYKFETDRRHIGPMAQDFHAVFNVGTDDRHIAPVDEGGIALAAIQGLNQKLDAKDAEIRDLKANVAELKKLVQSLAEKK